MAGMTARRGRWVLSVALVVVLVAGCSWREVQVWFALRGNPSVTADQARTIADKINASSAPACDGNYADFCVPNNLTAVHCVNTPGEGPEIGRTRVVGWDHFGLDPDGDKIACDAPPPAPPATAPPVTAPPVTAPPVTAPPATTTTTTTTPPLSGGPSYVYVADTTAGLIRKIDTVTLTTVGTFDVGGTLGWSMVMSGSRIFYVTTSNGSVRIGVYDTATGTNNRAFITTNVNGGLLRLSPSLPGRLFIGMTGTSPGSVSMYDISGSTGSFIASIPFASIGTMADFDVSADGTRVWAVSSNSEITEFRTSDLEPSGRRFPTGFYPGAVASVVSGGTETLAAATSSSGRAYVFDASDPSTAASTPLDGRTAERALAFSRDGSRLYTVVESDSAPELLTVVPRTDSLLRAPVPVSGSLSLGDLGVDPGTGRVFVATNDSLIVYNPDGSYGRTLTEAGPRSLVFSATGPTSAPPRLSSTPGNASPPTISSFTSTRTNGPNPLSTVYRWSIADADQNALTCRLDADANGSFEVTIAPCTSSSLRSASFNRDGTKVVPLRVTDGVSTASTTLTLTVGPPSIDQFGISIRPNASMTTSQRAAFDLAALRWQQSIRTGLPDISISVAAGDCADGSPAFSGTVDDLTIDAVITPMDGPGGVLGAAGPCIIRSASGLPAYGVMEFDSADVADLEAAGLLSTVITHEMGHVLGVGSGPRWDSLLTGAGTADPRFTGVTARAVWAELGGSSANVPVENTGGPGTADSHWRESVFGAELMTGFLNPGTNPITRLTLAALADVGYGVDLDAAEGFVAPTLGASLRSFLTPARRIDVERIRPRSAA